MEKNIFKNEERMKENNQLRNNTLKKANQTGSYFWEINPAAVQS